MGKKSRLRMTGQTADQRMKRGLRRQKQKIRDQAEETRKAFLRFMRRCFGL